METPPPSDRSHLQSLADAIDRVLPQTQCEQCGYKGCRPYAEAIARNDAAINRCPPGGDEGIVKLALLLNRSVVALDTTCGTHVLRHIADIATEHCIGCTLCITACPVDAIVGANKKRHAVIADLCTGCKLCIPPCPVDCIDMQSIPGFQTWNTEQADAARLRMQYKKTRLIHAEPLASMQSSSGYNQNSASDQKARMIANALEKARHRRQK